MGTFLIPLLQLQRFLLPGLVALLIWAVWRTVFRRDQAVGLVLYLGLVIIVDGYLNTGIYLPGLEKGSIRYSELCAVFLLINRPSAMPTHSLHRTVGWLLWIYFALLFLSVMRSSPVQAGVFDIRRLIIPQIVAFLVSKRGLTSLAEYRRFFLCLMTLIIMLGLFVFWDAIFDRIILKSEMLDTPIYSHNRALRRFGSFFLNPNFMSAFAVLVFPAAFVWTLNEKRAWPRLYAWIALLALVFCLVEAQSRAPLLAFGITILVVSLGPCGEISRKRRVGFLALFVLIFALFMPGFYTHIAKRFDSIENETSTLEGRSRQTTWLYTERMIADYPFFGTGFGESQFMKSMDAYGFQEEYGVESLDAPHNSYLQIAVYAGIPALAAFLLANIVLVGKAVVISLRDTREESTYTIFGLAVGITGFLACIYTDIQLFTLNVAPVYWVFFGLLLSLLLRAPKAQPA